MSAVGLRARLPLAALISAVVSGAPVSVSAPRPTISPAGRHEAPPALEGDFADPFVMRHDGTYYAFATGARGLNVQVAISTDLRSWKVAGDAVPQLPPWAAREAGHTWAPSVLARGSSYVLYYTARDAASGFQCISLAVASRPDGPYVDRSPRPFVCQVQAPGSLCGSIDPSPFLDADGVPYLLWKSDENSASCRTPPRIWAQRLSDDGLRLVGPASVLLSRDQGWEGEIVEGPSMVKHGGAYYLFYSANWYASRHYAIGYAVCDGPLGGCRKVTVGAPFVRSVGGTLGPGGQEPFTAEDGALWMAYHAWTPPHTTYAEGGARSLRLARVGFAADGAPRWNPP